MEFKKHKALKNLESFKRIIKRFNYTFFEDALKQAKNLDFEKIVLTGDKEYISTYITKNFDIDNLFIGKIDYFNQRYVDWLVIYHPDFKNATTFC